jgi:hypothetical protein
MPPARQGGHGVFPATQSPHFSLEISRLFSMHFSVVLSVPFPLSQDIAGLGGTP